MREGGASRMRMLWRRLWFSKKEFIFPYSLHLPREDDRQTVVEFFFETFVRKFTSKMREKSCFHVYLKIFLLRRSFAPEREKRRERARPPSAIVHKILRTRRQKRAVVVCCPFVVCVYCLYLHINTTRLK